MTGGKRTDAPDGTRRLLLDSDYDGRVLGDHDVDAGEAVVGKPVQTQSVHPTADEGRPAWARREVVKDDHAAFGEQLDDLLPRPILRASGIHEDQREGRM